MDNANNDAICAFIARKVLDLLDDCATIDQCIYQNNSDRFTCKLRMNTVLSVDAIKTKLQHNYTFTDISMSITTKYTQLGFSNVWRLYANDTERLLERKGSSTRRNNHLRFLLFSLLLCFVIYVFGR